MPSGIVLAAPTSVPQRTRKRVGFWRSMLAILLLCGTSTAAIDAHPHAAPKWRATDAQKCKGCIGIQGPCVSARWRKMSRGANAPHGLLFCTYFGDDGRCPRGFRDCFARATNRRTRPRAPTPVHAPAHAANRHARGREETALKLMHAGAFGGAVTGGGGGQGDRIAALKTQLQILQLQQKLKALGTGHV